MKKGKRKGKRILLAVLCTLAAVIALYAAFCLIAPRLVYPDFYRAAEPKARIPKLWGQFVPQGITRTDAGSLLICGYMPGDAPSRIFRIGADGKPVEILLAREDGSVYDGHAGGLTAAGKYVYISNASKLFVLETAAVEAAKDGDTLQFIGRIPVPCRASFCSSDGTLLYVGEYHADGYETEESHVIRSKDGAYAALAFGYRLDPDAEFGLCPVPEKAFSTPDAVQGFAVLPDGTACLSCSSGLKDSLLRRYDTGGEPDGTFEQDGTAVPLFILDSARAKGDLKMPHMSEDLDYRGGVLLMGFEAGALKFGGGLLPFSVCRIMAIRTDR